jgi:hypothetical protein
MEHPMCGEMDDEGPTSLQETHYNRFLIHAKSILARRDRQAAVSDDAVVNAIDQLFADALSRAMRDCESADPSRRYDMLSMQTLVFARLAGMLAGHLSLGEDPLRRVMEAMMHGYAEADSIEPDHGHDHDHDGSFGHFGHSH